MAELASKFVNTGRGLQCQLLEFEQEEEEEEEFFFTKHLIFGPLGLTNWLIPWNRALLEKLTVSQPVKKFPAIYGTRRFITAFTTARHLSLS
jgi:hypothetical protein